LAIEYINILIDINILIEYIVNCLLTQRRLLNAVFVRQRLPAANQSIAAPLHQYPRECQI
jgi:hypothetical protein